MSTNRTILIDNATLSGVERICGVSQIQNLSYIDNDILCLEKLLTAILFSDQLIAIDDYKDEFRSQRLKKFDFIQFKSIENDAYAKLATDAASFARSMTFSFEGSKPAGDVVKFFESIKIESQLRWDIFVSSEYLKLTYLVDDARYARYERSIDSMFRSERIDGQLVGLPNDHAPSFSVLNDSDIQDVEQFAQRVMEKNPQSKGIDGKSALDRMVFGYGWTAERSYFYNSVAYSEGSDVYLAPLRDAFCESCLRIDHPKQIPALIENLKRSSQETLCSILEPTGQAKFAMRLPFITSYLISKTDNPTQCIDLALSLRNTEKFQECRTIFHNFQHLSPKERVRDSNQIMQYLEQSCAKLMRDYAISTGGGLQFSVSVGMAGLTLSADVKMSELLRNYKHDSFSRVFRNVAQDMLNVERLGGLYEKLCSATRIHAKASRPGFSATPKFMENRESPHGRPAEL